MNTDLTIYENLNILCVEDEETILSIYNEMFSLIFKNVYLAKNGAQGLEIFEKEQIDIVLTDHSMPVMNGLEMSTEIRKKDLTIPIIMITALENLEMLRSAIDIHITNFIKKPISAKSIFLALEFVAKSIFADKCILQMQKEKIFYSEYQENLTYEKETKIIKNDVQDKLLDFKCEVFFQPRDILSGDSYSIRKLSENKYFAFIIDGMGKGISASVTAMMCCAYLNHTIDKLLHVEMPVSLLEKTILELIDFIAPNLLEDEVVSASFFVFDAQNQSIEYATFSMPGVLLLKEGSEEVVKLKSNNSPLTAYTKNIATSVISLQDVKKLLFFSDGLNENSTKDGQSMYGKFLAQDFKTSNTLEEFEEQRIQKVQDQEDDITYVFLTLNEDNEK